MSLQREVLGCHGSSHTSPRRGVKFEGIEESSTSFMAEQVAEHVRWECRIECNAGVCKESRGNMPSPTRPSEEEAGDVRDKIHTTARAATTLRIVGEGLEGGSSLHPQDSAIRLARATREQYST